MAAEGRLSRHLLLTYVLLSIGVGIVLSCLSLWTVSQLEAHLQRIDMGMAVERVRDDFLAGKDVGRDARFFHGVPGSVDFPPWLRGMPPGFHKFERDGRVWHAMASDQQGRRYILLRDYTDYEQSQWRSHAVTVAALAGGLLAAFILGLIASRRFVRPLLRLAEQVGARGRLPPRTRLAEAYPANEIGQLAEAFDATYNQLEQALERERLFTADVSHELRTPLMVVASSAEVLRDTPGLDPQARARAWRIQQAAQEMHQHLAAYLMLARGGAQSAALVRATCAAMMAEVGEQWRERVRAVGLRLECQADGVACAPAWPAALLRIVLVNLVRNALQHAEGASRIRLRAGPDWLEVEDDGVGSPDTDPQALCAPFVSGAAPDSGNLGLGLSLVQRICQQQGWRLSFERSPGWRIRVSMEAEVAISNSP
ncbi:sensor histidine kinase [Bordetella trematum]|uniref:sensor histidine kinase n=1 Tax=Bordetella trematum TaxID=123899 RepID=UPI000D9432DB|nr:HAMP domain-containing sensor histidine kinase [Bordetella trematum]SPU51448.1 two-component system sensor protein [Bordetella trematum]VDH08632.1 Signal transduction histidine-protein kinase ArlS [Bordetella trematum]